MCAGLCPTYWTTFGNAEKNRNGSCFTHEWDRPQLFWVFNSPPPPRGRWIPEGEGHVGRHCPYTNKIWCGCVHALLIYRVKTAKMQKFFIDSHSNENFISPFFCPPGSANSQKGRRRHIWNQNTPACKTWLELAALYREIVDRTNKQKKHTVKQIPRPSL